MDGRRGLAAKKSRGRNISGPPPPPPSLKAVLGILAAGLGAGGRPCTPRGAHPGRRRVVAPGASQQGLGPPLCPVPAQRGHTPKEAVQTKAVVEENENPVRH